MQCSDVSIMDEDYKPAKSVHNEDRKRKQAIRSVGSKRLCEEGFSWWTSMMLGIDSTATRPLESVMIKKIPLGNEN